MSLHALLSRFMTEDEAVEHARRADDAAKARKAKKLAQKRCAKYGDAHVAEAMSARDTWQPWELDASLLPKRPPGRV